MKELRDKQNFKKALYSFPALIVLVIVAFLLARGAASIVAKERESASTIEVLEEKNAALKERQVSLREEVERLSTMEGIIEEIRAKFNVTRPGEHLAIVIEEEARATSTEEGGLKRGWKWFLGLLGK
jgi:cell division protein FtsB